MKKILSLILCITMVATLAVLGASAESEKTDALKVGICVAGSLGDQGFYDSANDGLQKLAADYGVVGSVVECKNDASAYEPALVEAAEQNDVVVAVGWEFWDGLDVVAPEMPDTKFIFVDNGMTGHDNLLAITYKENQGSFLAGYIAMKLSKTGKVGVIGGEDSDTINNFIVGYKQGALYANPDGEVLDPIYTNDYEDPAKGKESALALNSKGADVIFQVADKTGLGVFEAAQEKGFYAIGVDKDQKSENPDVVVCSMLKHVGESVYQAVAQYIEEGVFNGGEIIGTAITSVLSSPQAFIFVSIIVMSIGMMFMNPIAIIVPIVAPIAASFGIDPMVYGAGMSGIVAIGSLTPPFGVSLYIMAPIAKVEPFKIAKSILPLWGIMTLIIAIYMFFPQLSTWAYM